MPKLTTGKKSEQKKRRLVLLDAHAIIHRAYHALPDFSSSKGEATGALYGLSTMLIKITTDLKPDVMVACFDLPKPTYRHQAYEGYKAGRAKTDDALVEQLQKSKEVFEAFSIPQLSAEGFEADDILGTLVEKFTSNPLIEIIIASGDMDTLQLVKGKQVSVFTLKKGISDTVLYDEEKVFDRFGFSPLQIPDYKGLAGDPSDNITGVPGIGDKTATILLKEFGTVEKIYEALEKDGEEKFVKKAGITPRIGKLLVEHEEEARFSKMLATIRRDAPVSFLIPEDSYKDTIDLSKISALCTRFEFRTLLARAKQAFGLQQTLLSDAILEEEKPKEAEVVDAKELEETALALWVVDSTMTNPKQEDILSFAKTDNFAEAKKIIFDELKKRNSERVYQDIELPLIPILEAVHKKGILVDVEYLKQLGKTYKSELAKEEKKIYELAGGEFNVSSPKQLGEVLYDKLQLGAGKRIKKTEGGARSTRESELTKLAEDHPIIPAILNYRELSKLLSTYIDPLPVLADKEGRVHTRFIQAGAATGRMASENPNMQNIPVNSEHGKNVRRAFIAPSGKVLLALDYSQMELRLAAILSKDEKLIEIFKGDKDVHTEVAASVFMKSPKDVTSDERRAAKAINFGILYGMGANALRASLSQGGQIVTQSDASRYLEEYFKNFSGLAAFLDETKANAARRGYTETMFGRRRYLDGMASRIPYIRAAAERMALNAPVQGSGADIVKLAIIEIDKVIKNKKLDSKAALLLQVHDELVFEVDEKSVREVATIFQKTMESIVPLEKTEGVILAVGVSIGKNWEDMEELAISD